MQINVSSNISTFTKAMDAFGKNQLPHALAMTLNNAAFEVRKNTIENVWPKSVNVRQSKFIGAMLPPIRRSNSDVYATKKNLRAIVGNVRKDRQRDYLEGLTTGYVKRPRGRNLAIPARDLKRLATGSISKANRPRQLLNRPNVFLTKLAKSGQDAIVRRATKDRYPLQMLYILEPSGKVRKQFTFYEDANSTVRRVMAKKFKKNFAKAKRTARPRR